MSGDESLKRTGWVMDDNQVTTRRRGAVLEEAILDAAWEELATIGYTSLTFEAVAKRARTSRPVLYRRWPTRTSLAAAAIVRHARLHPIKIADLGSFRAEMRLLMRKFADRAPPRLLRLLFEMSDDMAAENFSFTDEQFRENMMGDVIERALARGEVDPERLTPRILRVPLSLVMNDVVIQARQITDEAIDEILDEVFLPLVSPDRHGRKIL